MKMTLAQRDAWTAALRSGEYKQTTACLADDTGHCCLGVLEELEETPKRYSSFYKLQRYIFGTATDNSENLLIIATQIKYDAKPTGFIVPWHLLTEQQQNLLAMMKPTKELEEIKIAGITISGCNDIGFTFLEIADLIERCVEIVDENGYTVPVFNEPGYIPPVPAADAVEILKQLTTGETDKDQ